jgi:hypothetical protein
MISVRIYDDAGHGIKVDGRMYSPQFNHDETLEKR